VITLIIATRNSHKVDEIRAFLGDGLKYASLRDLGNVPEVDETGSTFAENARIKSEFVAAWLRQQKGKGEATSGLPEGEWAVLADDSGLEVDALGGAPGVMSARFASAEFGLSGNAPDAANNSKLLRFLARVAAEKRTARFRCALALTTAAADQPTMGFEGTCEGRIGFLPRGNRGFGYDPLFIPNGFTETFAELGEEVKNRISHRARALARLRDWVHPRAQ
jgi:non-canonical purine NTP pyrophosphatase (RdgB/HAM1 family)